MDEFLYNYMRAKYEEKAKLCYMDTGSFIVYIKPKDIYVDIAKAVETRFDTPNYQLDRPGPIEKILKNCINENESWNHIITYYKKYTIHNLFYIFFKRLFGRVFSVHFQT